jgi:hypothetical protein
MHKGIEDAKCKYTGYHMVLCPNSNSNNCISVDGNRVKNYMILELADLASTHVFSTFAEIGFKNSILARITTSLVSHVVINNPLSLSTSELFMSVSHPSHAKKVF